MVPWLVLQITFGALAGLTNYALFHLLLEIRLILWCPGWSYKLCFISLALRDSFNPSFRALAGLTTN
jgi:hypothetical protein